MTADAPDPGTRGCKSGSFLEWSWAKKAATTYLAEPRPLGLKIVC